MGTLSTMFETKLNAPTPPLYNRGEDRWLIRPQQPDARIPGSSSPSRPELGLLKKGSSDTQLAMKWSYTHHSIRR